jgi:hypothetical protein
VAAVVLLLLVVVVVVASRDEAPTEIRVTTIHTRAQR